MLALYSSRGQSAAQMHTYILSFSPMQYQDGILYLWKFSQGTHYRLPILPKILLILYLFYALVMGTPLLLAII